MNDFYEDDEPLEDILAAFERNAKAVTEPLRRRIAQRHRDEVAVSAARVKPKALDTIASVRMSSDTAGRLRDRANLMGVKTSDLLRDAAERLTRPVGFSCPHVSMTVGNGSLVSASSACGCTMQPIFATA